MNRSIISTEIKNYDQDFPGGPGVKTRTPNAGSQGFDPLSRTRSHMLQLRPNWDKLIIKKTNKLWSKISQQTKAQGQMASQDNSLNIKHLKKS